jgi:hypothetical protein
LQLSQAEMAVVFQHLWSQPASATETMLGDLNLDEASLIEGRRSLVERGFLFEPPRRSETVLSPSLEPVLTAVTRPQVLGVLKVSTSAGRDGYLSWTPATTVFNYVTKDGGHMLEALPDLGAIGETVSRFSDLGRFKKPPAGAVADPEEIARKATLRGVFLCVVDPASPEPGAEAIAWLVSADEIWLMEAGGGEAPQLMPASATEIGGKVTAMMKTAVQGPKTVRGGPQELKGDGSGGARTVRARRDRS